MRSTFFLLIILLLISCGKQKTVLICGDHLCVNKLEAEQYFQENLSIEVRIVDKKVKNEIDLVELNLKKKQYGQKSISLTSKNRTKKNLKILSNEEINKIKKDIKNKSKEDKVVKKIIKKEQKIINKENKNNPKEIIILKENVNKRQTDIVDVCTILEKCSIDEITKYLLKQGKKKDFPDITTRQ